MSFLSAVMSEKGDHELHNSLKGGLLKVQSNSSQHLRSTIPSN